MCSAGWNAAGLSAARPWSARQQQAPQEKDFLRTASRLPGAAPALGTLSHSSRAPSPSAARLLAGRPRRGAQVHALMNYAAVLKREGKQQSAQGAYTEALRLARASFGEPPARPPTPAHSPARPPARLPAVSCLLQ